MSAGTLFHPILNSHHRGYGRFPFCETVLVFTPVGLRLALNSIDDDGLQGLGTGVDQANEPVTFNQRLVLPFTLGNMDQISPFPLRGGGNLSRARDCRPRSMAWLQCPT